MTGAPPILGLSSERLARVLREAAGPGGDTRDYLRLAEEIAERNAATLEATAAASRP
jgi:hypothetical protein